MVLKISSILILLIANLFSYGQDHQFSQFYAAPLYLAPSFAGGTEGSRVVLNYRNQWTKIPGAFVTYAASFDHFFPRTNSGIGLIFFRDRAGSGALSQTSASLQYSHNIMINRNLFIKPALQFGYIQRAVDYTRLTFVDQMNSSLDEDEWNSITREAKNLARRVNNLDFATSALIYSNRFWFGLKADHLSSPSLSLLYAKNGGSDDDPSKIPLKITAFGGAKVSIRGKIGTYKEESLTFAFQYKSQEKYDQLDLGAYWLLRSIVIGIWYRGLPVKKYDIDFQNHDAMAVLLGYQLQDLKVGYSYDFTVSSLRNDNSGGSHEVSLIFEFNQNQKVRKKRRRVVVACPKF